MFYKNKQKGFSLLEVVIGLGILSFIIFGLFSVSELSLRIIHENTKNIQAAFLLEEGIEAIRVLRDSGWQLNIQPLNSSTDYYLEFSGAIWKSTTTNLYIDNIFERKFVFSDVYRNTDDDISDSGTLDSNAKKVTVYVSWLLPGTGTTTKSISTYLINLFKN